MNGTRNAALSVRLRPRGEANPVGTCVGQNGTEVPRRSRSDSRRHDLRIGFTSFITAFFLSWVGLWAQERPQVEVPYGDQILVLSADRIETSASGQLVAEGAVVATYADASLKADLMRYDPGEEKLHIEGNIELVRGKTWLKGSQAEINIESDTGIFYEVSGFTDEELYIRSEKLTKIDPETYLAEDGYLTACEGEVPKWSFRISKAQIKLGGTARLKHTLFRVKKIPLLYFPYMIFPTGHKERSSGFMIPTVGNSSNKGRQLSQSFYLVLGRSADLMLRGDYYSKRGTGSGFTLRTRPSEITSFELSGEWVDDRLGRGGGSIIGLGETRFENGFRAVADFNLVSNFLFRQSFSDSFFTATRPTENSRLFLTNNFRSASLNVLFAREETISPNRNIVTQVTPSFHFGLNSARISKFPLYLDFDTSASGFNRADEFIETPKISQRLDFFPRVYFSIPLFQGLRATPRFGFRETFYGDSLDASSEETHLARGENLHRRYLDFGLDLKGWGLSRTFDRKSGVRIKHLVEPQFRYRWIRGIDEVDQIIRFDEHDAIADTSEVEYSIVNRFFKKGPGKTASREWLSFRVGQKYFFDSTFGGAIKSGVVNQFFPLNSMTGVPYATNPRDFSPVSAAVRLMPAPTTSIDLRGDFDTKSGDFRNISVTGFWSRDQLSFATTYFVTSELLEGLGKSNQVQGRVGLGNFTRGLSAFTAFSYDAFASRFLNHLVRISYFWDCCGLSAEVGGFNLSNRQEQQVRFAFYLKGIGSFGTIRQPEGVF